MPLEFSTTHGAPDTRSPACKSQLWGSLFPSLSFLGYSPSALEIEVALVVFKVLLSIFQLLVNNSLY